ncbi:hypothetical protein H4R18_000324 [Coemansia javaensis]|uniref:Uncharacterized protein n=1 Tax=Coemansia javaensis TaxID=2761396 RepID=A0A9W8LN03_9FUNG|nr:hypothetical protein H4R18_000324 [Coemansia javaensis]
MAQSRRRQSEPRLALPLRVSRCISGSEETVFGDDASSVPPTSRSARAPRRRAGSVERPKPLSVASTVGIPELLGEDDDMGARSAPGTHFVLPGSARTLSSCPPSARNPLHEQLSSLLKSGAIEEEDGDGGVVIHNGLKRLSLPESGIVMHGRPRIVNV